MLKTCSFRIGIESLIKLIRGEPRIKVKPLSTPKQIGLAEEVLSKLINLDRENLRILQKAEGTLKVDVNASMRIVREHLHQYRTLLSKIQSSDELTDEECLEIAEIIENDYKVACAIAKRSYLPSFQINDIDNALKAPSGIKYREFAMNSRPYFKKATKEDLRELEELRKEVTILREKDVRKNIILQELLNKTRDEKKFKTKNKK